ncbi:hypothetical protein JTE90_028068 [Oedothorax gibbosus]|uniref:Uncharacterized protein n=1 Tax=Oedothorax gibbosus TaxID=931172 RepID=A0AAV6V8D5_9ARAC|nr:hypothetical protein JTE90_028068 [Oedothorax gibbosus]
MIIVHREEENRRRKRDDVASQLRSVDPAKKAGKIVAEVQFSRALSFRSALRPIAPSGARDRHTRSAPATRKLSPEKLADQGQKRLSPVEDNILRAT